jgi:hypothetical protein
MADAGIRIEELDDARASPYNEPESSESDGSVDESSESDQDAGSEERWSLDVSLEEAEG